MDENTKLMIQLASVMMQQSQHAQQPPQLPPLQQQTTNLPNDPEKLIALARQISNGTSEAVPLTTPPAPAAPAISVLQPSTDQLIMAELAKQLVMNASSSHIGFGSNILTPGKKPVSDKPTTIAQIMQMQNLQNGFGIIKSEPQTPAKAEGSVQPAVVSTPSKMENGMPLTRGAGGGPIRIRSASGRILRPGIDNFNRFGTVANPGIIMHAMEVLRHRNKRKRGPKEKETFPVFMYCLPDKNSKLPKFSSLDPVERCLVDQHQQEGYGYPAQDYINGIPRKTALCLSFSPQKFHNFMVSIYPKLEDRMYDMYRIDKTRRLIKIEAKSPRELKDMKYQGSVIIIPYDNLDDRPAPIIHRNFDECFSSPVNNTLSMMQNFNIPLTSLPGLISDAEVAEVTEEEFKAEQQPVFPGQSLDMSLKTKTDKVHNKVATDDMDTVDTDKENEAGDDARVDGCDSENSQGAEGSPFGNIRILEKVSQLRSELKDVKRIHIKPENLFLDLLQVYRSDTSLEQHKLSVCFQMHIFADDTDESHDEDVDAGSILVMFWEEAFRRHFTGNQDQIPIIDPSIPEDLFTVLGRVLVHGLILDNYLPLKFSPACLAYILAGKCSDRLLLTSIYRLMSDSEKEVLESAMDEVRMDVESFSPPIDHGVKVILGSYGCRKIPNPGELDSSMATVAKTYLIRQIYWPLMQLKEGIKAAGKVLFEGCKEDDVITLYQALAPSVTSLIERLTYIFSSDSDINEKEKKVKVYFEQYLYKLTKAAMVRFLYQWCGFDCLCVTDLYVKFSGETDGNIPIFSPRQAMICLPSAATSLDDLKDMMESQLPSVGLLDS